MKMTAVLCTVLLFIILGYPCFAETGHAGDTRDRIIINTTAESPDPGEFTATGYAAGLWDIRFAFNENIVAGAYINLPFYVMGAFPHISLNTKINGHWSVGGGAITGILGAYIDNPEHEFLWIGGGHLAATGRYGRHTFNFNTAMARIGINDDESGFELFDNAIILPNAGYRFSINKNWSFLMEVTALMGTGDSADVNGKWWFILYGLRVTGDIVFGDFGFCFPVFKDYLREMWKYTPLGIPYFTIGLRF